MSAKLTRAAAVLGGVAATVGITTAALCVRRRDLHVIQTAGGFATVFTVPADTGDSASGPDEPVRVLAQGGVYQSATYLGERRFEPVFAYYRAFDHMFEADAPRRAQTGLPICDVLMIGGGGYAYPKHLLTTRPDVRMDVVEVDPAVTRAAWRWFFLDELVVRSWGRLALIEADGRAFLESGASDPRGSVSPDGHYDAIINDAFSGSKPVRSLATVEAARAARARLRPGGLYLANVVSREGGVDLGFLRDTVATLHEVFAHVSVVPSSDEAFGGEDNYLVLASDAPYVFADAVPFDNDFLGRPLWD